MKLLPSPSCSSSSSFSTSTFDANVCNPRAAATPSCLSGILRRILCSGSLPTHPSDQITEETNSVKSDDRVLQVKDLNVIKSTNETKPTAGIVARLMGLESMPEMKQNHNSLSRSQSMNSVEHFYKHRGKQQNRTAFSKISTKNRHGRKSTRKVESECSSDELSPVSVLDCSQFIRDPKEETPLTGLISISSTNPNSDSSIGFSNSLNPRRKLSPELEISQSPSRNDDDLIINEGKIAEKTGGDNGILRERFEEEICKITEMELGESNWKYSKICEEHEEVGVGSIIEGFDSYILEGLIEEFVEQMYDSIFI